MKIPSFARNALAALVLATLTAPAALAQDATLTQAKRMIDTQRGQGRGAFELLSPLEEARAGDPEFDYLLGLAAIDAGEFTRGVFALERVLAVRPDHPQARAEIARAYFLMGENRTARAEFEAVKAAKPPSEVVATIDRFLSALDQRQSAARSGMTGYIELGLGHDSNANTASGVTGFAIPNFPAFSFTGGARSDSFTTLAAGFSGRKLLNDNWSLSGGGNVARRYNAVVDRADTGSMDGNIGLAYLAGDHEISAALQAQVFDVDETRFRNAIGGLLQWRYALSATQQIAVYGQTSRLTYPNNPTTAPAAGVPAQTDRNAYRNVVGFAWANSFDVKYQPTVYVGVYGGEEKLMQNSYPEFGQKLFGMRVGGQVTVSPAITAYANLSYEDRHFGPPASGVNLLLFPFNRLDREWSLRIGGSYTFAKNWSFNPAWALTENHSNVIANAFRRNMIQATIRYDFR
jgi:tetratricopeptide (TPR) repeat protein